MVYRRCMKISILRTFMARSVTMNDTLSWAISPRLVLRFVSLCLKVCPLVSYLNGVLLSYADGYDYPRNISINNDDVQSRLLRVAFILIWKLKHIWMFSSKLVVSKSKVTKKHLLIQPNCALVILCFC